MKRTQNFILIVCIFIIAMSCCLDSSTVFSAEQNTICDEYGQFQRYEQAPASITTCETTSPDSYSAFRMISTKPAGGHTFRVSLSALLITLAAAFYHILKRSIFLCTFKKNVFLYYLTCLKILYRRDGKKSVSPFVI